MRGDSSGASEETTGEQMMPTRFENIKTIALQGVSAIACCATEPDYASGDRSMVQRCGETNQEAIERARRARAVAAAEFSRLLDRVTRVRQAIHQAQDIGSLRAALRPFDLGADDDLSIHVKHMLRMIDKRA